MQSVVPISGFRVTALPQQLAKAALGFQSGLFAGRAAEQVSPLSPSFRSFTSPRDSPRSSAASPRIAPPHRLHSLAWLGPGTKLSFAGKCVPKCNFGTRGKMGRTIARSAVAATRTFSLRGGPAWFFISRAGSAAAAPPVFPVRRNSARPAASTVAQASPPAVSHASRLPRARLRARLAPRRNVAPQRPRRQAGSTALRQAGGLRYGRVPGETLAEDEALVLGKGIHPLDDPLRVVVPFGEEDGGLGHFGKKNSTRGARTCSPALKGFAPRSPSAPRFFCSSSPPWRPWRPWREPRKVKG